MRNQEENSNSDGPSRNWDWKPKLCPAPRLLHTGLQRCRTACLCLSPQVFFSLALSTVFLYLGFPAHNFSLHLCLRFLQLWIYHVNPHLQRLKLNQAPQLSSSTADWSRWPFLPKSLAKLGVGHPWRGWTICSYPAEVSARVESGISTRYMIWISEV